MKCCYCDFKSSERGARTHIAKSHSALSPPPAWGRARGPRCGLCGWTHTPADEAPQEGWANRRKRFRRGRIAAVQGSLPGPGRFYTLGRLKVPAGVTHIKGISISVEICRGPFSGPPDEKGRRYCLKDNRYHFVATEYAKAAPRRVRLRGQVSLREVWAALPGGDSEEACQMPGGLAVKDKAQEV